MSEITEKIWSIIKDREDEVSQWFDDQHKSAAPFFYSSVDLRHSGTKMVPVDTNLFPAGFNLLSERARERAAEAMKSYFENRVPYAKKLLLVPENHTRNLHYLDNVATLKELIEKSGLEVRVGGMDVNGESLHLTSELGVELTIEAIHSNDNKISVEGFEPDIVLVNNDLSSGFPTILKDIEQLVFPPIGLGWYKRRKTGHFDTYAQIINEFSQSFELDPWLISAEFEHCGRIDFKHKKGLECVAIAIEKVLTRVRKKYDEYNIKDEPYVFIKADSGTYGMGIMTASSPDDVLGINKKTRNKMDRIKEGVTNSDVIIQEGVPTIDRVNDKPAEPMMYLINGKPIGCNFRVNENRDAYSNLNSSGVTFDHACEGDDETSGDKGMCPVQALVARLAALAATRENYDN